MTTSVEFSVADNAEEQRYEARLGEKVIGLILYRQGPERITLIHTHVDSEFEGEGVASRLVVGALDDIRRRGLTLVPLCPFVRTYLRRHPEYSDLVATT